MRVMEFGEGSRSKKKWCWFPCTEQFQLCYLEIDFGMKYEQGGSVLCWCCKLVMDWFDFVIVAIDFYCCCWWDVWDIEGRQAKETLEDLYRPGFFPKEEIKKQNVQDLAQQFLGFRTSDVFRVVIHRMWIILTPVSKSIVDPPTLYRVDSFSPFFFTTRCSVLHMVDVSICTCFFLPFLSECSFLMCPHNSVID